MNAMKTLVVVALLLVALFFAHQYLNYLSSSSTADEADDEWDMGLKIDTGSTAGDASRPSAPRWSGEASSDSAPPFQPAPAASPRAEAPTTPTAIMPASTDRAADGRPPVASSLSDGPTPVAPDEATELAKAAGFDEAPPYGAPTTRDPASGSPNPAEANPYAVPDANPYMPSPPAPYAPPASTDPNADSAPPANWPSGPDSSAPTAPTAPNDSVDPSVPLPVNPYDVPANDTPLGSREDYDTFMGRVSQSLAAERLAEAHLLLSQRYRDPATSAEEARRMEPLLDQLAGTVIYSPDSYLEAPYEVIPTDTIESIAERYNVPPGLLIKINGLDPNVPLRPGQRIKVVRGTFEAVVDVQRQELILMLRGERYAGRFPIALGPDMRQEGSLMVTDKDPTYWRGARWIGLGQHMGLHEAAAPVAPGQPLSEGCIGLSRRDIEDLYDILSVGSKVMIRR